MVKGFILLLVGAILFMSSLSYAREVPFTQEDRDRLRNVELKIERLEATMKEFKESVDKRFEQIDKRFDDMFTFLWILAGIFTAITGVTIGFAIWDRRSMIRPFETRIREIEEGKIDRLINSLRDIAQVDKNVADILRKHNLL